MNFVIKKCTRVCSLVDQITKKASVFYIAFDLIILLYYPFVFLYRNTIILSFEFNEHLLMFLCLSLMNKGY